MKAIVCHTYGAPEVLQLEDVAVPAVPDDGVLVRVRAASVNPADMFSLTAVAYAMRLLTERLKPKPQILGTDFAGTVEAVGSAVTQFKPGDAVFGAKRGAFAEYVCVSEARAIVPKPANVTFEQAAAVPIAAVTALQALRDHGQIRAGQRVLVNGASGGVGTFAVQLAKALGTEVTGVSSTGKVALVRSLGADYAIDYTKEDFTHSGQRYDLLLDIAGSQSWAACRRVLASQGTFVGVGAATTHAAGRMLGHFATVRLASLGATQKVVPLFIAKLNRADLVLLQELLAAGQVTPVVDRQYPLREAPEALRYLREGHARGKIVLTV